jgi:sialic acid synthase SpsE
VKDIKKNEKFTKDNIKVIRPGYGIEPYFYEKIINRLSPVNINKQTPLKKRMLNKLRIKISNS